jgi:hypothetical protein
VFDGEHWISAVPSCAAPSCEQRETSPDFTLGLLFSSHKRRLDIVQDPLDVHAHHAFLAPTMKSHSYFLIRAEVCACCRPSLNGGLASDTVVQITYS